MEGYLNYLKKEYEKTDATHHLKVVGWDELANRIGLLETPKRGVWFRNFAIALGVLLIFLTGAYQIAKASLPGDALYPVKILSERIIQKTSGDDQIIIDHRAEEIVGLSKEREINTAELEQVVIEYKEVVDQKREEMELSGETDPEFKRKLEEQHSEFDNIGKNNPEIREEIKQAHEASDHNDDSDED